MSREFRIKGGEKILAIIKSFSSTEKMIFGVFVIVAILSAVSLLWAVNKKFLVPIPSHGGKLTEGVVGLPRSINPVLAVTDADRDLSTLIFAGLMKYENGKLVPDLAKSYSISDDGLTYTFTLRDNLRFHDGVPLTADDIEFTIQKINDLAIKSPRRADWANITVKKVSSQQIQFILKHPYAPFLDNTTVGIIPKHIWGKIDPDQFIFSQFNIEPIGAGPYKLSNVQKDSSGIPLYYALSSFNRYHHGEPFINELDIYFYPNEKAMLEAYTNGTIESMSRISGSEALRVVSATPATSVLHTPLPRIFGIFFNQNQAPIFSRTEVRQALDMATDKNKIVKEVLSGYGVESDSPLPFSSETKSEYSLQNAKDLLTKAGWAPDINGIMSRTDSKKVTQTLEFSIATADSPDLKLAADLIKSQWEKLGARVTIKVFEYGDLSQSIILNRKYDALLFGESINKDLDLYAFWHSSQRNPPGLNVAMYTNSKVDKLLEDARIATDEKAKDAIYDQFNKIIHDEVPAVFLYSPDFIYVIPAKLHGVTLSHITNSPDRFSDINKWYITTDYVWKIFGNINNQ